MATSASIDTADVPAGRFRPPVAVEKSRDLPALTGLRFFAAFFIFVGHATPIMFKLNPSPQLLINLTNCFLEVGMQLFFVLSGFVIHYNYANVGRPPHARSLAKFYIARFARIYPLYLLFIAIQIASHGPNLRALPFFLGLTQSWVYIVIKGVPLIGRLGSLITWSISTEWFFYCLYPLIAWLFAMTLYRVTGALALTAVALLGLVLAVFIFQHSPEVNAFALAMWGKPGGDLFFVWLLAFSPVGRLPPFLIGIATAHIFMGKYHQKVGESEQRLGLVLLTVALVCAAVMCGVQSLGSAFASFLALFVYPLCIAVIIYCCASYRSLVSRGLSGPLLIACGNASYSIYLFHTLILELTKVRGEFAWTWYEVSYVGVRFAAAALITIVFSAIMYRIFEAPARTATRRLLGRSVDNAATRTTRWFPVALCVGIPVVLSIFGWIISLRS